jgi:hypothetical protein
MSKILCKKSILSVGFEAEITTLLNVEMTPEGA